MLSHLKDRRVFQVADASGGSPPSLMDDVRRVIMGRENLDMAQREFLLHREQELQDHVAARIREYEAMLTVIGWACGIMEPPPPETSESIRQKIVDAVGDMTQSLLERSERTFWDNFNPLNAIPTVIGVVYDASGGVASLIGADETAERYDNISTTAYRTDIWDLYMNAVGDLVGYIVDGLKKYWDEFWAEVDTNGFLIAYGKLRIDAGFLAAELAIDIGLGVVTGGAAGAASKVIRVTGRRLAGEITEVVIKVGNLGDTIPDINTVLRLEVRDTDIPDNVERLMDEDNLGGASTLDDTAARAEPNAETGDTTTIDGDVVDRPPPPVSGRVLTRAERDYLRRQTASDDVRDLVNEGQPIASPMNPQPDEWVPGLMRQERFAADHIVPASRIMDMDGFADLPQADQISILNLPDNFHPMSVRANSSRGNKTFEDWTEHVSEGLEVDPAMRARMIPEEQRLTGEIQQRIYYLLRRRQDEGVVELPFRSDGG